MSTPAPRRRFHWWNEETRFAWAALTPALLFFAAFVGFPFGYSFYLSFHDRNMTPPPRRKQCGAHFVGQCWHRERARARFA